MAEFLAGMDIRQMHFDERAPDPHQCIQQGYAGVSISARIDQKTIDPTRKCLDPVDQLALAVRPKALQTHAQCGRQRAEPRVDLGEGLATVDLRLPLPEKVQVRSV